MWLFLPNFRSTIKSHNQDNCYSFHIFLSPYFFYFIKLYIKFLCISIIFLEVFKIYFDKFEILCKMYYNISNIRRYNEL